MSYVRRTLLAATAGLVLVPVLTAPGADAATPAVKISVIRYNPPGADTTSTTQLDGEYVTLKNTTSTSRSITGWTLRDAQGHVYKLSTFTLAAGASVRIHTGPGVNSRTDRYWGLRWYVWNNDKDTATLKNAAGTTVHTCGYVAASTSTTYNGVKYC